MQKGIEREKISKLGVKTSSSFSSSTCLLLFGVDGGGGSGDIVDNGGTVDGSLIESWPLSFISSLLIISSLFPPTCNLLAFKMVFSSDFDLEA